MGKRFNVDALPSKIKNKAREMVKEGNKNKTIQEYINSFEEETGKHVRIESVQNWRNAFVKTTEKMEAVSIQARAIVQNHIINGTDMEEAAVKLAMSKILGFLIEIDDLEDQNPAQMMIALARLQDSSVKRARLKQDLKAEEEGGQLSLKFNGISDDVAIQIRQKIQGVMSPF